MIRHLALALVATAGLAAATPVSAQADFRSCLSGLRSQAAAKGISGQAFDLATSGIAPDMKILELMNSQPEFKTEIWDYLSALVDDQRVQDGTAAMRQWGKALANAEARFGVDRYVIAGVWGVESDFGKNFGDRPLVQSLVTLSCYAPRRQAYFTGELMATLKIVQDGDIDPASLKGSWAGAFGHTQFMPSTFQRLAVDGDGDGRRDVVNSVADATASTANFLKKAGWVNNLPWGYEVRLPAGFNAGLAGRKKKRDLSAWAAMGVTRVDGRPLSGGYPAAVLIPAGINGPAFIVTKNFDAVYSYNAAESYGLAIALLGDRLKGLPGIRTAWPTDDPPLSRAQRRELQQLLTARGYDVGEPDGKVGQKTRDAIKDIERRIGLEQRGRPGGKVLEAVRG
ncbi:lytic murein transglycosylase [Microvirga antarctica]|uniref:lytic murein transglycosylase n=1 Tax=Microvirga antarctica TaxID=2819233 RepID=UPI001B30FD92|nr:lytic murein transglycosylase [Microvirga antarctica]